MTLQSNSKVFSYKRTGIWLPVLILAVLFLSVLNLFSQANYGAALGLSLFLLFLAYFFSSNINRLVFTKYVLTEDKLVIYSGDKIEDMVSYSTIKQIYWAPLLWTPNYFFSGGDGLILKTESGEFKVFVDLNDFTIFVQSFLQKAKNYLEPGGIPDNLKCYLDE